MKRYKIFISLWWLYAIDTTYISFIIIMAEVEEAPAESAAEPAVEPAPEESPSSPSKSKIKIDEKDCRESWGSHWQNIIDPTPFREN